MGCGVSVSSGCSNGQMHSTITVSAGQHTQHCLWVVALKHDKYFPKLWYLGKDDALIAAMPVKFSVTPCTGGCLYPTYGVGTSFSHSGLPNANHYGILDDHGTIMEAMVANARECTAGSGCTAIRECTNHHGSEGRDVLTITEAIYPTKIVMTSRLHASVITYTMNATSLQITHLHTIGQYDGRCEMEAKAMKRLVEAEAQAILAESPLPSEAAVRPVPMQQQPAPVPMQQQPAPVPVQQQPAPVPVQQQPVPVPVQQPVPAQTLTKFCSSCGAFLDASTQFCGGCGTPAV